MASDAVLAFLEGRRDQFQLLYTDANFNPYLRDGNGRQRNWRITIRHRGSNLPLYFSTSKEGEPLLEDVLDTLREEVLAMADCGGDPLEFARRLGLPTEGLYDRKDADFVWRVATRHADELRELLGDLYPTFIAGADDFDDDKSEPAAEAEPEPEPAADQAEPAPEPPPPPKAAPVDDGLSLW